MNKLIIVSGPSGVGKNTLVDAVLTKYPRIKYFKKYTTRDRRPNDRDAEATFLSTEEFDKIRKKGNVAFQYDVRGKSYGLPVEGFAELRNAARVICLSDFYLIRYLQHIVDTTTIYVTAPIELITQRLLLRGDTEEQRNTSIKSIEAHLQDYEKFRDLFNYEIANRDNIETAQEKIIKIIQEEISYHRKAYNFLLPNNEASQSSAEEELDDEKGNIRCLPPYGTIEQKLETIMNRFSFGSGIFPVGTVFMHGLVTVTFYSKKDKERKNIAYGSFELQGPKREISETSVLLEKIFPELQTNEIRQKRMSA